MKGLETMRLTSRLLALALLVVIAAFTNLVSPVTKADDGTNPCIDGCWRGYQICMGQIPQNQGKCATEEQACETKCGPRPPLAE